MQRVGALSVVDGLAAIAGEWSLAASPGVYLISGFGLTFAFAAPLLRSLEVFSAAALGGLQYSAKRRRRRVGEAPIR